MNKRFLNNKGLSLVEVVMSAMLLAVVVAALFASYSNANNIVALSKDKLVALTWAQSMMEGSLSGTSAGEEPSVLNGNWLTLNRTVNTSSIAESNESDMLTGIKATVTWTE